MDTNSHVSDPSACWDSSDLGQQQSTCILAGNSRLELMSDGLVKVEAQSRAFEAGLAFARVVRDQTGVPPSLSVAFDHKGTFRTQFLSDGLTNSQKRNPKLSQLNRKIIDVFEPACKLWDIPLSSIHALHEDSARAHAQHTIVSGNLPAHIVSRMVANSTSDLGAMVKNTDSKVTCVAVTSEYFRKAAIHPKDTKANLEVFFEDSPWSRVLAYVRGLQLSHLRGMSFNIRLNLVDADGSVHRGEIAIAK